MFFEYRSFRVLGGFRCLTAQYFHCNAPREEQIAFEDLRIDTQKVAAFVLLVGLVTATAVALFYSYRIVNCYKLFTRVRNFSFAITANRYLLSPYIGI